MSGVPQIKTGRYAIRGLSCANCAQEIERTLNDRGTFGAVRVNFASGTIAIDPKGVNAAQKIIRGIDPGAKILQNASRADGSSSLRVRIIVFAAALLIYIAGLAFAPFLSQTAGGIAEYAVFIAAYLLAGWKVLVSAVRNLFKGKLFDENFLMAVATAGAFAIGELPEAAGVMLFYYVGDFFQQLAVNRSRRSIAHLINLRPEFARKQTESGMELMSPEEIRPGDTVVVKAGEKIPVDGVISEGASFVDTSALTGESAAKSVVAGDEVAGGTVNGNGLLTITVTREFSDSSVARIIDMVENVEGRKTPSEKFISAFSRVYTPIVVLVAAMVAFLPPLILPGAALSDWTYRALVLLVISCPCALVISVPLSYFGGIGAASRRGILVKGSQYLDALCKVDTVVLDKTGTMTRGTFEVTEVRTVNGMSVDEILAYAAAVESGSTHPVADAVQARYAGSPNYPEIRDFVDLPGYGLKASVADRAVVVGNDRMLHREDIPHDVCAHDSTVVHVAVDGVLAGTIHLADSIKAESVDAVNLLRSQGVASIALLSGDGDAATARVADEIGVGRYHAELLPSDKLQIVEDLMGTSSGRGGKLLFAGDGTNDAPVISRSDVGVAMGGVGTDLSIEAADVVIVDDNPGKIPVAMSIARRTRRIVLQNIIFALGIKIIFVALGATGAATMWQAVLADVGVALIAVLNATRALFYND